jgi:hypothetical protein
MATSDPVRDVLEEHLRWIQKEAQAAGFVTLKFLLDMAILSLDSSVSDQDSSSHSEENSLSQRYG